MFGDGAANQGQYYEVANMSSIWKLPVIFLIENNHYGMGTPEAKAHNYLPIMGKLRGYPGILCDGSNVFAVKEAIKFCKEYSIKNGPIILEIDTYRYYGHGPSDPGTTYRKAEEVKERRAKKDCIEFVKKLLIQYQMTTTEELEKKDKEISNKIKDDVQRALNDPFPSKDDLLTHVYVEKDLPFIRACEYKDSIFKEHKI
jgi:pyruvate dehydrogenase E1 component alpha subunit